MNNHNNLQLRKNYRSRISIQLVLQYFASLLIYGIVLVVFIFLAWRFCSNFTWFSYDPLYQILHFIKEYILIFIGIPLLCGYIIISFYFFSKPLQYLDEIITAAEKLALSTEEPVVLPKAMADTQNEMNLVREKALENARAAKDAEQRKNDLIVYLAHDLKTPLTSVIGYLTLLRDEPQISKELQDKYRGIALDKALRLEDLINEFFDITRFNLTHLELEKESINLTRMLEQIMFEFNPILTEKNLSWNTQLSPDIQLVCDPDKLERVIDNLLRNAINYSYPETGIMVSLKEQDKQVILTVKNQGKTIPPENLSRIFDQFFRLDSSRATATGGAGLGLAIANEIVELHGGTILSESADESIVFTVSIPLS